MEDLRTMLLMAIGLLLLSIPLAFLADYELREVSLISREANLPAGAPRSLGELIGAPPPGSASLENITFINTMDTEATILLSCCMKNATCIRGSGQNLSEDLFVQRILALPPKGNITLVDIDFPCSIISQENASRLLVEVYVESKTRPYAWAAILSLATMVAGTALGMTFVGYWVALRHGKKNNPNT